jgi:acyl dehydratase
MKLEALLQRPFPKVTESYSKRDVMLYGLGVGAGADPLDERELPFVYEADLRAIPSMTSVLGYPGFWLRDPVLEVDWLKLLHGEQYLQFFNPLPPEGKVTGEFRVLGVTDKGPDKGAIVYFEKMLSDAASGDGICSVRSTYFLRGDGGCGSYGEPITPASALPDRSPDIVLELPTLPHQALIYRLSGDYNPIHADPAAAAEAGFRAPILHGLCTFGIACRGLLNATCDSEPARLKSMSVRFSSPVFPGETIRLEIYQEGNRLRYRAKAVERDLLVLDRGEAMLAAA